MLGFGVVGTGVYRMLRDNREAIIRRVGAPIEVVRVGVRDPSKEREVPPGMITTDLASIVDDPNVDVIVEVMGGISPAGEMIDRALRQGKHVVTANKELIAKHGAGLVRFAYQHGLDMHYEAAVGGGIPLVQPIKHQLAGNDVVRMMGILNGTTNFILTAMTDDGREFEEVLAEAQRLGYAEADPSSDVDGFDAQFKLAILSSIAFSSEVLPESIYREGIRGITQRDIQFADLLDFRIKLLAIVESTGADSIRARVHPALISKSHPLATVSGVFNALWFEGDFVGDVMFIGRGAGAEPTASAVVGDLVDIGRNIVHGGSGSAIPVEGPIVADSIDGLKSAYYVRLIVEDRPKVLGGIASTFGASEVSLAAMEMRALEDGKGEIVFLTHPCVEIDFRKALAQIEALETIDTVASWFRVVGS
jgi:homoserine dehydrogenase